MARTFLKAPVAWAALRARGAALAGALSAAGIMSAAVALPAAAAVPPPPSLADLTAGIIDAVVNISTAQNVAASSRNAPGPKLPEGSPFGDFFDRFSDQNKGPGQTPRRTQSLGSGFVIDSAGIIVTNNHVIEGADEITANFNDGTKLVAKLIGRDPKTDLAVLEVKPPKPLKAVKFGDSEKVRVGDWVMAIGNPFGFGGTVTVGILSARDRDIQSGPYDDFLQTDASINRGNSGGPLFNMDGDVIGINTAIISQTGFSIGIGFSVPSVIATNVIDQLRQFGETRRGWLGVRIQDVSDEIAEGLGITGLARGALISGVTAEGPGASAGLVTGDVVTAFNGQPIKTSRDLPRLVANGTVGQEVELTVVRKGAEQAIKAKLGRLEETSTKVASTAPTAPAEPKAQALGLKLAELTPKLREQFKIKENVQGVVVEAVEDGSAAAEKRVEVGSVIVEVGQEAVTKPDDVDKRIEALRTEKRRSALLLVVGKDGEYRFVALRLP